MLMTSFGRLEMEFRQGYLTHSFSNIVGEEGACLSLVGNWLREKREHPVGRVMKRAIGMDKRTFAATESGRGGGRQLTAMRAALPGQEDYQDHPGTQLERVVNLLRSKGLRFDPSSSANANSKAVRFVEGSYPRKADIAATLFEVTQINYVFLGRGVCIGVRVGAGLHAVAAYRSHGGTLYFFDPNMGVYSVNDAEPFFKAWQARYEKKNKFLSMASKGPFYCV
jgi:hypothetical protein